MTAHELAKRLLAGPDVRVIIRGYEGGFNDVSFLKDCVVSVDEHIDSPDYGRHGQFDTMEDAELEREWGQAWFNRLMTFEPGIELWGVNQ